MRRGPLREPSPRASIAEATALNTIIIQEAQTSERAIHEARTSERAIHEALTSERAIHQVWMRMKMGMRKRVTG